MSFIDAVRKQFSRYSNNSLNEKTPSTIFTTNKFESSPNTCERYYDIYDNNWIVNGIANDIINNVSQAEIELYNKDKKEENINNPFIKCLLNPNTTNQTSFKELINAFIQEIFCSGRVYFMFYNIDSISKIDLIIFKSTIFTPQNMLNGEYQEIKLLADNKDIIFKKDINKKYYKTNIGGKDYYIYTYFNDVLNTREINPKLKGCIDDILTLEEINITEKAYLKNESNLNTIFNIDPGATPQQYESIKDEIKKNFNNNNSGQILFSTGDIKIEKVAQSQGLNSWYDNLTIQKIKNIAFYFGFPFEKLGIDNKFSNQQIATTFYLNSTIKSYCNLLSSILTNIINDINDNNEFKIQLSINHFKEILNAETEEHKIKAEIYLNLLKAEVITIKDVRDLLSDNILKDLFNKTQSIN